ncbi:MAG TPA: hypothetical protein DEB39_05310 [Planctomycetaceae bacterium]|nr:hypothetical protein [Planctomycetaceae bacterium]
MKMTLTMNAKEQKLSLVIDLKNGRLGKNLSAAEAENVVMHLEEALQEAGREAFKQWLLGFEFDADILVVGRKTYRFKMIAEKEFLAKFGHISIPRRLYQQDSGGPRPTFVSRSCSWPPISRPAKSSNASTKSLLFRAVKRRSKTSSTKWASTSKNMKTN